MNSNNSRIGEGYSPVTPPPGDEEAAEDKSHGPDRNEVMAYLEGKPLSDKEKEILVQRVFDRTPIREIAKKIGQSKSWVAQKLRRSAVREQVAIVRRAVQRGFNLPAPPSTENDPKKLLEPVEGETLKELAERVRRALNPASEEMLQDTCDDWAHGRKKSPWQRSLLLIGIDDVEIQASVTEEDLQRVMTQCPRFLLEPIGRPVLELLVDQLEMLHFGKSGMRRPLSNDADKQRPAEARRKAAKTLAKGFRRPAGNHYGYRDLLLGGVLHLYAVRLKKLKALWAISLGDPLLQRVAHFRKACPDDLASCSDIRLRSILNGDLIKTAAKLAEDDTGLSAELFLKGYRQRFRNYPI